MSRAADMAPVSQDDTAEFEVRDDEEQKVKLAQTVELLLAAGYFRARIKGLSPFDKVVGGMTWCIATCSYDIDVDLLFQENSTIGQKIALTEKIVGALKRMKCPHRIEPHQIQGLDFIHIFPVVQWLVKRALEAREETGDYIRAYSVSQFNKYYTLPQDVAYDENKYKSVATVDIVKTTYRPQRKYRRPDVEQLKDEETRVQSTLLEYGRRYGLSRTTEGEQASSKMTDAEKQREERSAEEEERYIGALMKGMSVAGMKGSKVSAQSVSSIVNLQSSEIRQIAGEYAEKQPKREPGEKGVGGVQHQQRLSTALQRQIDQQQTRLQETKQKFEDSKQAYDQLRDQLQQAVAIGDKFEAELSRMLEIEEQSEQKILLDKLRHLVVLNEKLKKQEADFRESCKEEMERLQQSIEEVKSGVGLDGLQDEEHARMIEQQYESNLEKLQNLRRVLGKRNREIAALQRRIDEVPTRAELSQYQCRFVELYNQVAAKHKETKQFFALYNTLDDTRMYLNKEVNLLNSINDTFEQAMSSQSNKEQFLKQFEQIVEGVKQNRAKVERRKQEEKMKRDELNDKLLEFLEKQRLYFKTVKDFQEECRKNEILLSKLPSS